MTPLLLPPHMWIPTRFRVYTQNVRVCNCCATLRDTQSHCRATPIHSKPPSHFPRKKSDPPSAFRHWPQPRQLDLADALSCCQRRSGVPSAVCKIMVPVCKNEERCVLPEAPEDGGGDAVLANESGQVEIQSQESGTLPDYAPGVGRGSVLLLAQMVQSFCEWADGGSGSREHQPGAGLCRRRDAGISGCHGHVCFFFFSTAAKRAFSRSRKCRDWQHDTPCALREFGVIRSVPDLECPPALGSSSQRERGCGAVVFSGEAVSMQ